MNKKFEYFLNAIHYCLWLGDMKFGDFMGRIVNVILDPIPKYLFTKEYKEKYYERLPKEQMKMDSFFYDKKAGYHIGWANHNFGAFYSGYPGFLSFVIGGIYIRFYDEFDCWLLILFAIPVVICYIPAYKAVFSKDKYLKYFKQFEKKEASWHKKWKWITIAFCIGSVVVSLLGICVALGILFFNK